MHVYIYIYIYIYIHILYTYVFDVAGLRDGSTVGCRVGATDV